MCIKVSEENGELVKYVASVLLLACYIMVINSLGKRRENIGSRSAYY